MAGKGKITSAKPKSSAGGKKRKYNKKKKQKEMTLSQLVLICLFLIGAAIIKYYFIDGGNDYMDAEGTLSVHYIDVGQGDSTLIISNGETMLIDCGESSASKDVIDYLSGVGVKKIDYLVATHPHSDHMGGMAAVIDTYDIGKIIMPSLADNDIPTSKYFEKFLDACEAKNVEITQALLGQTINVGGARAKVVAPCSADYDDVNNYSVSLDVSFGKTSFLLIGDAEALSEKEMLKNKTVSHATVYKAGHHGSRYSSCKEFLQVVAPEYAVISCGEGNSYGHPNKEAIDRISQYTDKIYRTDLCGDVVMTSDGEKINVTTERN